MSAAVGVRNCGQPLLRGVPVQFSQASSLVRDWRLPDLTRCCDFIVRLEVLKLGGLYPTATPPCYTFALKSAGHAVPPIPGCPK